MTHTTQNEECKHEFTQKTYIKEFLGSKVFLNGYYGQLVAICKKCGYEKTKEA